MMPVLHTTSWDVDAAPCPAPPTSPSHKTHSAAISFALCLRRRMRSDSVCAYLAVWPNEGLRPVQLACLEFYLHLGLPAGVGRLNSATMFLRSQGFEATRRADMILSVGVGSRPPHYRRTIADNSTPPREGHSEHMPGFCSIILRYQTC